MSNDAQQMKLDSLSYSEKLLYVVANWNAAQFAYERLAVHHAAASVQMTRLWEAAGTSRSSEPEPKSGASSEEMQAYVRARRKRMVPVLYETHFYFVAWTSCRNMLKVLVGQPEFLDAKKVYDSYSKHFEHYAAARNSFEHFQDRLPGHAEEHRIKEVRDNRATGSRRVYFGFEGGNYKHSNETWDITPSSLALLDRAIDEVLAAVHRTIDEQFRIKFMSA